MQKIAERLNRSSRLGGLISFFSGYLANYRGVPILFGIVSVIISLVLQLAGVIAELHAVTIAGIVILHLGLMVTLIGILLAEPLGKG